MTTMRWCTMGLALVMVLAGTARAARDPKAAGEAVRKAELAMAGQRYAEAADSMEEAYRHDPNPLWLANAGYARMMAGDLGRALTTLDQALADPKLTGDARARAVERRGRATTAKGHVDRAVAAAAAGDPATAARANDEAFESVAIGLYLLEAAGLYEKAGDLALASERFTAATARQDLEADQRLTATDGLARVTAAMARAERGPKERPVVVVAEEATASDLAVPAWVLIGSGVASIALGVTGFVVSEDKRATWEGVARDASGAITGMDDDEARALEDGARTWWNVGLVASGIGVAAVATGVILLATDGGAPATRGTVEVSGVPWRGGGVVMATGRF